jgi:ribonuclease R
MELFAIDAAHSRDLDDAVAVDRTPDGWTVTVAIADVASSVPQGGEVDARAREVLFSRYAADRVRRPMLPIHLSEDALSLSAWRRQPAVVATIPVAEDMTVGEPKVRQDAVRVRRASHEEAWVAIDTPSHPLHAPLQEAWGLASRLLDGRRRRGALAVYDARRGFMTDEEGRLVPLANPDAHKAYILVQELMILANTALSATFARNGVPMLYRNHRASAVTSREALLSDLVQAGESADYYAYVQERMGLLMERARHGASVEGHYGLNLPVYGWFTSPLRRYADLVNQRLLLAALKGEALPYGPDELADIAAAINAAEDAARDGKGDHFKRQAEKRAEAQVASGFVAGATDQEMERVVKQVFVSGDLPDEVAAEIARRVADGRVKEKEMARLLLCEHRSPSFAAVRAAIRSFLVERPHVAGQIANYATQAMGMAPIRPRVEEGAVFRASASTEFRGAKVASASWAAATKKEAVFRAMVDLFLRVAGLEPPAFEQPSLPEAPAAPAAAPLPGGVAAEAAKNVLNEFCQKRRLAMPVYASEQTGPSHSPTFTATATVVVGGATMMSCPVTAATKKDAEKLAAADLLGRLREAAA